MDIVTSYDNWGGSGDRRSILSGNSEIFDGTETTYLSYGNGAQINIDIIFSGLEGKLYIDCIKVIRSQYAFINKEILLNGKLIGTFNDNVDHPLPMLTIKKNDKLTIRGKNNESGGGTYPTNIREIYFKTYFVPDKSLIYHDGLYKKYSNGVLTGNIIPTLTNSNVSPDGIARASGELGGTTYYAYAYKAFNKTNTVYASSETDAWHTPTGIVTNSWLSFEFNLPKTVVAYSLVPFNYSEGSARMPKSWVFQGSTNSVDWVDLHTVNNSTGWGTTEKRTFAFSNKTAYKHYRIYVYSNNGNASYIAIGELEMFEIETAKGWTTVSDTLPTSTQFLKKGIYLSPKLDRRLVTLEPIAMTQRNDILDVGEVGKIFSETIDLKKYFDIRSIKVEVK